jgi:cytoskeleton protein RodZ
VSDAVASGESGAAPAEGGGAAGAALLKERRRQGLSLGDISRQLKLSVRQVEALERDDYSAYKGPVFIHGFIRNYAKLLGLDPEPLIRATDLMLNPPAVPTVAVQEVERPQPAPAQRRKARFWPAAAVVFLVVIVFSFYFGGRRVPDVARNAPTAASGDDTASSPKAATETKTGAGPKARSETRAGIESAAKPAAKPETKTQAKAESVERRAPPETGAALAGGSDGRVTVRMIFDQDSWVEIKDRAGNTIFGQLNPAGSRRSVSGEPPLAVVVGNAAGVRLFQGDKSIDLGPHTRVDVARLTLE